MVSKGLIRSNRGRLSLTPDGIKAAIELSDSLSFTSDTQSLTSHSQSLTIEVVWGDITKLTEAGQVHCVGHYQGVVPQWAELALDRAVSGWSEETPRRLLITEMTHTGALSGALGTVSFFPWDPGKIVAVAGMGHLGTFRLGQLRVLAGGLARVIALLPGRDTLTTVLIGSGEGNLAVSDAVAGMVQGVAEALQADSALILRRLRIVEKSLDRALEIRDEVERLTAKNHYFKLEELGTQEGGEISTGFISSLLQVTLADAASGSDDQVTSRMRQELAKRLPALIDLRPQLEKWLAKIRGPSPKELKEVEKLLEIAAHLRLRDGLRRHGGERQVSTRLAFRTEDQDIFAAAITDTVTVPERLLARRLPLVEKASRELIEARSANLDSRARDLFRLLVPNEFRSLIAETLFMTVEHDRRLNRVPWEMLVLPGESEGNPISLTIPLARQLRTLYSPSPSLLSPRRGLRALVIGGPGDPEIDGSVKLAQREAAEVSRLLIWHGVQSVVLIGLPEPGTGEGTFFYEGERFPPADFIQVMGRLLSDEFELVHYCGHAAFDTDHPENAGWVFGSDLLTARDLENMARAPRLIFANACLSAALSPGSSGRDRGFDERSTVQAQPVPSPSAADPNDPDLVASLADGFFLRGVRDYIGTAWEVPLDPALKFASRFYETLLGKAGKTTIGEAVRMARKSIFDANQNDRSWAAYRHYGDPTRTLEL